MVPGCVCVCIVLEVSPGMFLSRDCDELRVCKIGRNWSASLAGAVTMYPKDCWRDRVFWERVSSIWDCDEMWLCNNGRNCSASLTWALTMFPKDWWMDLVLRESVSSNWAKKPWTLSLQRPVRPSIGSDNKSFRHGISQWGIPDIDRFVCCKGTPRTSAVA